MSLIGFVRFYIGDTPPLEWDIGAMNQPEPVPRRQPRTWGSDPVVASAISMAALGLSFLAMLLTIFLGQFRELRQENAAHSRALDARLDAAHSRIDQVTTSTTTP